jgi:hypothetical protein
MLEFVDFKNFSRAKLLCNVFDTFKSWKMIWLSKKHYSVHEKNQEFIALTNY